MFNSTSVLYVCKCATVEWCLLFEMNDETNVWFFIIFLFSSTCIIFDILFFLLLFYVISYLFFLNIVKSYLIIFCFYLYINSFMLLTADFQWYRKVIVIYYYFSKNKCFIVIVHLIFVNLVEIIWGILNKVNWVFKLYLTLFNIMDVRRLIFIFFCT